MAKRINLTGFTKSNSVHSGGFNSEYLSTWTVGPGYPRSSELNSCCLILCSQDLKSSNIMENCIALIAVTSLVNKEMIPALLPLVVKLMQHKRLFFINILLNSASLRI